MRSPSVSSVILGQLASATKLRHLQSTKWQPPFWTSSPHWRPREGRRALPSHQLPFLRKEVFPQNALPHPLPTHTPVDFCLHSFDQVYVIWGPLATGVAQHGYSVEQPISSGCRSKTSQKYTSMLVHRDILQSKVWTVWWFWKCSLLKQCFNELPYLCAPACVSL